MTSVFSGRSGSSRQSGSSRSRPIGSKTMPERMCAPTSEPFSTTTTDRPASSSLSRIAAARPAGPAPTTTTSNSIASRAGSSSSPAIFSCFPVLARGRPAPPRNAGLNCADRRRLSIPPSSTPAGMLEAAILRAPVSPWLPPSDRRHSPRRRRRDLALVDRGRRRSRARRDRARPLRRKRGAGPAPRAGGDSPPRRADGLLRGAARAGGGRRAGRSGALGARHRRRRGDARRIARRAGALRPAAG